MQHNILKHGFTYCGIIYLLSGDARLAYQKKVKVNMTTLDLRMELAQEIQNIPDSEQLLTRAIDFVRNLTKHEDFSIVLTGDALRLWNRTAELAVLTKGWDGAYAMPIEKKAVQNMQRLIKAGTSEDFKDWVLFPDDNGTLLMQSKDGMASISIGNSSFSFVYTKGGKVNAGENIRFSALKVLKTLRDIALSAK
jgi:hypothetical protein